MSPQYESDLSHRDLDDPPSLAHVTAWWATAVTRIAPGEIEYRGYPVQELIGRIDFVSAIWLLTRGELPTDGEKRLLDAVLVASADHGPQAPSIASARMAASCGIGINSAIANGVNVLGDIHGGAGQQCVVLLRALLNAAAESGRPVEEVAAQTVADYRSRRAFVPGFGHRFHPVDPRRAPLVQLVQDAIGAGDIPGDALRAGLAVEAALGAHGQVVPMNIDGISAIIYAELGVPPELARGLFVLSRSVGILAHAWEEASSETRIKGPLPPPLLADYTGHALRQL